MCLNLITDYGIQRFHTMQDHWLEIQYRSLKSKANSDFMLDLFFGCCIFEAGKLNIDVVTKFIYINTFKYAQLSFGIYSLITGFFWQ